VSRITCPDSFLATAPLDSCNLLLDLQSRTPVVRGTKPMVTETFLSSAEHMDCEPQVKVSPNNNQPAAFTFGISSARRTRESATHATWIPVCTRHKSVMVKGGEIAHCCCSRSHKNPPSHANICQSHTDIVILAGTKGQKQISFTAPLVS